MSDDMISVIDAAKQLGRRKEHVFKVLKRLRIRPVKWRSSANQNQLISHLTLEEYQRVNVEMQSIISRDNSESDDDEDDDYISTELGVFYLIRLEPELDPGRFKVGFAAGMSERLRQLRCSAPLLTVVRTWPCKRLWEKTAIDSVTTGCEQLHTEVFRTGSLDEIVTKCDQFFSLMPSMQAKSPKNIIEESSAVRDLQVTEVLDG